MTRATERREGRIAGQLPRPTRRSVGDADDALTDAERDRLAHLEAIVERGVETFVEVGRALIEIRDERLYRVTHGTFEAYIKQRWGWGRAHAYRLMDAAVVASVVSPTGDVPLPNEAHARELAPLVREDAQAAVAVLQDLRGRYRSSLTAEHMRDAVTRWLVEHGHGPRTANVLSGIFRRLATVARDLRERGWSELADEAERLSARVQSKAAKGEEIAAISATKKNAATSRDPQPENESLVPGFERRSQQPQRNLEPVGRARRPARSPSSKKPAGPLYRARKPRYPLTRDACEATQTGHVAQTSHQGHLAETCAQCGTALADTQAEGRTWDGFVPTTGESMGSGTGCRIDGDSAHEESAR